MLRVHILALRKCHEESKVHQQKLPLWDAQSGCRAEINEVCKGVCLSESPFSASLMGARMVEMQMWIDSGCIGLSPSLLDSIWVEP